ncbi:MAG: ABC transporter ATP-binding protein, partial [Sedimenticola sp.]|nr:ABC transporter ATP-binding protein [Sedimenticola sp.]
LADNRSADLRKERNSSEPETSAAARKDKKRLEAERRKQLQPLRKQVQQLEKKLEELNHQSSQLEAALADPAIYDASQKTQLKTLLADKTRITQELNETEEQWLMACEELEQTETALVSEDY